MSVKYINRKRSIKDDPYAPCAQLVNVPELQGTLRCKYCKYKGYDRTQSDYEACVAAHDCGEESLLWAELNNSKLNDTPPISEHFSPSPVVKSLGIDNMTRYIQLWSCDLQGYECCRLCQFYAARVAADQSISECSNTHACGRNGSWWDLLTLSWTELTQLPDFLTKQADDSHFYTMDGVLHSGTPLAILHSAQDYTQVRMNDGNTYFIVNLIPNSTAAWYVPYSEYAGPESINFGSPFNFDDFHVEQVIMLTRTTHPIAQALVNVGMPRVNLLNYIGALYQVTASDNKTYYFTKNNWSSRVYNKGTRWLVCIYDVLESETFYVRFGVTNYYLGVYNRPSKPSEWSRMEFTDGLPSGAVYVTITKRTDPMVEFLLAIGCRKSIFNTLQIR